MKGDILGDTLIKAEKFAAEFYKGYWRNDHLEGGERVGGNGDDN